MATEILRPNASGTLKQANQYPATGEHYDKVDEEILDNDTTYLYTTSTSNKIESFLFPVHSVGSGPILKVTLYWYYRSTSGSYYARTTPSINGIFGAEKSTQSTNYILASETFYFNAADMGYVYNRWTWDNIDSISATISLRTSSASGGCRVSKVSIEVEYYPTMQIEVLRPNAVGSETHFSQYPANGYNWDKVDESYEEYPAGDGNYIYSGDVVRDLYAIQNTSVGAGEIKAVRVFVNGYLDIWGSSGYVGISGSVNGYNSDSISIYDEQIFYLLGFAWGTNPANGNPWSWTNINNLQAGPSMAPYGDSAYYIEQVWGEVDYILPSSSRRRLMQPIMF